jgi:hypothetical protein
MELAVGGEDAERLSRGTARQQPHDERMGIGPEGDAGRIRQPKYASDVMLCRRDHLAEDFFPLTVRQPGGVFPAPMLRIEADVRP